MDYRPREDAGAEGTRRDDVFCVREAHGDSVYFGMTEALCLQFEFVFPLRDLPVR